MARSDKRANSHRGKIDNCRFLVTARQNGPMSLSGKNRCGMISAKHGGAAR
jgi:hypothetical protein